jgi:hypothetical protein
MPDAATQHSARQHSAARSIVYPGNQYQIDGLCTGLALIPECFFREHTLIVHHTISTTFSCHYGFALERALDLS